MSGETKYRYTPEDLEPRDPVAEEAWLDAWLERNKDALSTTIEKARAGLARGMHFTLDEVMSGIKARQRTRSTKD